MQRCCSGTLLSTFAVNVPAALAGPGAWTFIPSMYHGCMTNNQNNDVNSALWFFRMLFRDADAVAQRP